MSNKIVVPLGMCKAFVEARGYADFHRGLEAALRWLSENPIVPTDKQTQDVCDSIFVGPENLLDPRDAMVEWQRRMFLAPDHSAECTRLQAEIEQLKARKDYYLEYQRAVEHIDDILAEVSRELERAKVHGEKFPSLHEAYAVILEEVAELWDIVRQKRCNRYPHEIREELIQIAAMAVKAIGSMENFTDGSV